MALDFATLKKNSKSSLDKLTSQLSSVTETSYGDDDLWKLEVDKAGNGQAVIRFLPPPSGEDVPFVRRWDHGFKGPGGKWYIENSRTTLGENDPVSEYNTKLWNSGSETDKQQARDQKRRLYFYSNIYVVKDPANPENEGKVFRYRYGKSIFDILNDAANPQFDGQTAVDPFDLWNGADLLLRARKGSNGYRTYDKSEFGKSGTLGNMSDEELEEVWKQCKSLQELVAPEAFKSYAELKAKLFSVLELGQETVAPVAEVTPMPERAAPEMSTDEGGVPWDEVCTHRDEDEDDMSFFKKLAND